ncbi:YbgA family protein [Pseudalkalibacillus hwajinpoensis]|uniref:YbgA family protein n=1 Tax=Guptibacillus hwajinpoensis TaxID=208199 RepID=UPI001CFDB268|nr:YbgA family protein [Pseudalkalibacillus hwajinpoensis]
MSNKRIRPITEKLWARNKYTVMAKGYEHYKNIGEALKKAQSPEELLDVYDLLKKTLTLPYTKKGMRTTLQHMWGYFKKRATSEEKEEFIAVMNEQLTDLNPLTDHNIEVIQKQIWKLLETYPSDYLLQSSFVQPQRKWNEVYDQKQLRIVLREDYLKESSRK